MLVLICKMLSDFLLRQPPLCWLGSPWGGTGGAVCLQLKGASSLRGESLLLANSFSLWVSEGLKRDCWVHVSVELLSKTIVEDSERQG